MREVVRVWVAGDIVSWIFDEVVEGDAILPKRLKRTSLFEMLRGDISNKLVLFNLFGKIG